MRKMFFLLACLMATTIANLYTVPVSADDHHHSSKGTNDNFFPLAQVVLTPVFISEDAGFSLLMEGGSKSYRFNGTFGFRLCEQHLFKVGGEYLSQKFHYKFGHEDHGDDSHDLHYEHNKKQHWTPQWAVGGKYRYLFCDDCCNWLKFFEFDGYYAHAENKNLRDHHDNDQSSYDRDSFRQILGGKSWGLEAGTAIDTCWNNGILYVGIDYDQVRFKKHRNKHDYNEHRENKDISGVGATVALEQPLWCDISFGLKYQYKRAYDYIIGLLNWSNQMECGDLDLGVFVNHVWGKEHINSSTTLGFTVGFTFGIDDWSLFGDCCAPCDTDCCIADCSDLSAWIAAPAVYMPQVISRAGRRDDHHHGDVGGPDGGPNEGGNQSPNEGGNDGAVEGGNVAANLPSAAPTGQPSNAAENTSANAETPAPADNATATNDGSNTSDTGTTPVATNNGTPTEGNTSANS